MVAVYKQQARGLKDLPGQTASFVPPMLGEYVGRSECWVSLGIVTVPYLKLLLKFNYLRGLLLVNLGDCVPRNRGDNNGPLPW
jgi:hypothetical protein